MKITYIIQKSRRRSISVSVLPDNLVLVKAPYGTSERTVQEFLLSKKDWITKHLEKKNNLSKLCAKERFLGQKHADCCDRMSRQFYSYFATISV
ncbi:YgjP-like metallopeptidase domain-containing protein [Treponema succinifaciens]|uniref:YgjP-like metallopeptidase domain-containing protein n=1 Tax=Treponema succinifaciens TaxID=167 RepID=UPI003FF11EA4